MSKVFDVAPALTIKAMGPSEAEDPLIYIRFDDYPEEQVIVIFAKEIKALIAALTDAAVWLADQEADNARL